MHVGLSVATTGQGMLGGPDTYVRGLLAAFQEGHGPDRTTVLVNETSMNAYRDLIDDGIDARLIPGFNPDKTALGRTFQLAVAALHPTRFVAAGDLDLVHYPVAVPLPRTRLPRVMTLHDVRHLEMPEHFSLLQRAYRRVAYDHAAHQVDHVITVSEHARQAIIDRLDVDPARVTAVYHGIDHKLFQPVPRPGDARLLDELEIPARYIVYPAALWPHKNHLRLFAALADLRDLDLTLVLTGATYGAWPRLRHQASRLGVAKRVRHLGYLPGDTMPALYRHAVALVYPTLYEGFGAPPLEAMACGCPCVLPPGGAVAEVTQGIGEIADPYDSESIADAIRRVVELGASRRQLVERGLARSRDFTWSRAADEHLKVYEASLGTSSR